MDKLHNNRGETLIEVLVSILVAVLSVALLFGCVMVSTDMDKKAKVMDENHYKYLTAAANKEYKKSTDEDPVIVTITQKGTTTSADVPVVIYGEKDMFSYKED